MKKAALSLSIILLFSLSLFAREITIVVNDIDLDMPLEGAIIKAEAVEYETDADGRARITVADRVQTTVQVAYPGYENARIIVPVNGESTFTVRLRLGGDALENEEIIVEANQPGVVETKTGRSVSVSGKDLARTAEIGVIEDVMTSIKLLPGVGYTGMFNARPSIRGGDPGDLIAVFDGFYISNPYYWGGGASIFDPRMVQSAELSHGVFSARYGHTISGLLEIVSRKPDSSDVELELGLSSSAANLNVSYPLAGKGGIMLMGKVTYWDPFVEIAKLFVDEVNYIKTAPYIRSASFSADYQFTLNFGGTVNGFIGGDGAGAFYKNDGVTEDGLPNRTDFNFDWGNLQGFLITGLTWTPKPSMVAKVTLGGGFLQTNLDGYIEYALTVPFSDDFKQKYGVTADSYTFNQTMFANMTDTTENWQARTDYDWELGRGFLFSAGVQGLYMKETIEENDQGVFEGKHPLEETPEWSGWRIIFPADYSNSLVNQTLTSSAYTLLEWASPTNNLGVELGLRVDHLALFGDDFTLQTKPAFNPRLNTDWTFLKNKGVFDSIT
ncbi:MAG: TonB-dependent receptor, partial [Treponema sp.]|nr:TonB-dependent receptor [Treponema sp.]